MKSSLYCGYLCRLIVSGVLLLQRKQKGEKNESQMLLANEENKRRRRIVRQIISKALDTETIVIL